MHYHNIQTRFLLLGIFLLTLAAGVSAPLSTTASAQGPLDDFPLVITCQNQDTHHVFYLSRVTKDGTATFTASDRLGGTITIGGEAKAAGNALKGGSCAGKTLKELRASGQARDVKP